MPLRSILRQLMRQKKLSELALAKITGITQPAIHRILSGETENPKIQSIIPIAQYFHISVGQLLGLEPLDLPLNFELTGLKNLVTIPLRSLAQVADISRGMPASDKVHIFTDALLGENAFSVVVEDSTMRPLFVENTRIIVDPTRTCSDLDYVICLKHGDKSATFKQLLCDGERQFLKPLNKDFHVQELQRDDVIIGKVVQSCCNWIAGDKLLEHSVKEQVIVEV